MQVTIVYAQDPHDQFEEVLEVAIGATIADVINQSSLLQCYPQLNIEGLSVGIFAKRSTLDARVASGDRVEIYRPLMVDPKQARRLRAQKQAKKG